MALIRVPGFGGIYVVDTNNGEVQRVGREGGLRHPINNNLGQGMRFDELSGQVGTAAWHALQAYGGQGAPEGGGGGSEGGGGFEMSSQTGFELSPQEQELLNLQIESIKKATAQQDAIFAREESRRKAYNRWVSGERWSPKDMEEEQGQLAARGAHISGIEQERLEKALNGDLPVSPGTAREIAEGREIFNERARRAGGPGYETSESGQKGLARLDESASMLEEADRKGYIERGIRPSIDAATFAQQAVGQYIPTEVPGLGSTLQALQRTRLGEGQLGVGYGQLGLGYAGLGEEARQFDAGLNWDRQMFEAKQAADYINSQRSNKSGGGGFFDSGFGKFIGALGGGGLSYLAFGQQKKGSNASGAQSLYGSPTGYS